ncbi:MAG: DUF5652 family protein [Candidatus Pacearchaeota archaeon]|nr:DUF5652 family protein [Candidatus Pacearchaeota archaeon]
MVMFDSWTNLPAEISPWMIVGFILISIWSLIWKGIALWKAAKRDATPWFVILLMFNTVGILEILYIFLFSKMKYSRAKKTKTGKKRR